MTNTLAQTPVESRVALVEAMVRLEHTGLNTGSAGNASARMARDGMLITPSGVGAATLAADSIVALGMDGEVVTAGLVPSSEWRMHRDIYRARPDINAIVHTHSCFATALACLRRDIPAFHYMVAIAGGDSIRCARYATFGTQALSEAALDAIEGRMACLLANHGVLALGSSPAKAVALAVEVENLARQYTAALSVGDPVVLGDDEMRDVMEKFKTYGQRID